MVIVNGILFLLALLILIKSAEYATRYASRLARILHISEFLISFFIVAVISVFPETIVAITSGLKGIPEFGFGALLGGNIADLTLILGIVALSSRNGIKITSEIINRDFAYLVMLSLPVLLGFDAHLSRLDGIILILGCAGFFLKLYYDSRKFRKEEQNKNNHWLTNLVLLAFSLAVLLLAGYFTVNTAVALALDLHVPSLLLGLIVVAIGTCMPELIFSLKAVQKGKNTLALGDLLGTVILDATFVIGLLAIISPFSFNPILIYFTGLAMVIAGLLAMIFIKTQRTLTKREGIILVLFYVVFAVIQAFILAGP